MVTKAFDRQEYSRSDEPAKNVVRKHLDKLGFLTNITEDYRADITAYKPQYHEVEIKRVWVGDWPDEWDTIHIPERKKKLMKGHVDLWFWILRNDLAQAWVVSAKELKQEYLKEIKNKEVSKGEFFFCIPVRKCYLRNLN